HRQPRAPGPDRVARRHRDREVPGPPLEPRGRERIEALQLLEEVLAGVRTGAGPRDDPDPARLRPTGALPRLPGRAGREPHAGLVPGVAALAGEGAAPARAPRERRVDPPDRPQPGPPGPQRVGERVDATAHRRDRSDSGDRDRFHGGSVYARTMS